MWDIFLSYSREDAERARELVRALARQELKVWWDREIPAGWNFTKVINKEVWAARSVVVLWSKSSISSDWVMSEAAIARHRGVLIPVRIDQEIIPTPFNILETVDLVDWSGEASAPSFQRLVKEIDRILGSHQGDWTGEAPAPSFQHLVKEVDHILGSDKGEGKPPAKVLLSPKILRLAFWGVLLALLVGFLVWLGRLGFTVDSHAETVLGYSTSEWIPLVTPDSDWLNRYIGLTYRLANIAE